MLRRCHLPRCPVQYAAVSTAAGKLNELLNVRVQKGPVPSDVLKQFLRADVMPILRGTAVDRRHDSAELRRFMSQLLRDSAFAAVVVRARPGGPYVTTLVDCIKHDHERMQFVHKMTSNQASRVIEHLCRVGVRDPAVYAPLVARLDFNVLKEVGRAMFALTEEGMYQEVVSFIVPLYCREVWTLTYEGGEGYTSKFNKNCNAFDAVRVLRVLSKAVRGTVEKQRLDKAQGGSIYPLPVESIQQLRTNLTAFIIDNKEVLRGGHWINFTRAMVHFPEELKTLRGLELHPSVMQAVNALNLPRRDARRHVSETLDTDDMALLGLHYVFAPVERQREEGKTKKKIGDNSNKKHQETATTDVVKEENKARFDVPSIDLTKLLSIIEVVPISKAVQQRRLQLVIEAVVNDINTLHFTDLVRFIQTLRMIEGSSEFSSSLSAAVSVVSRLLDNACKNKRIYIPYDRLVNLATLLTAFRVKSCKGFMNYLSCLLPTVDFVTVEDATCLMNALAMIAGFDGAETCSRVVGMILEKVGLDHEEKIDSPLLFLYPVQCAKLLRATVLLSAVPSLSVINRIFGGGSSSSSSGSNYLKISPALRAAGGSVLFDVARSLYHFSHINSEDIMWQETVWSRGIVGALMPLLRQMTSEFHEKVLSSVGKWNHNSYVPLAWRSAVEAIFPWVDVNLDTVSLTTMQQRIEEIYPFCLEIATMSVRIAEVERQSLRQHPAGESIAFSSNAIVHFLYFLLMFEHILYHGTWQAEIAGSAAASAEEVKRKMYTMKSEYNTALSTPVCKDVDGNDVTALTLLNHLFMGSGADADKKHHPLLDRSSILEITTNLPFAISLVVSQGPINEVFCERAAAAIITVSDGQGGEDTQMEFS